MSKRVDQFFNSASTTKRPQTGWELELSLRDELNQAHRKVSAIWMDRRMKHFIEKYQPELFDAMLDFVAKPDHPGLEWLGASIICYLPIRDGHVVPDCFDAIMDHADTVEDMRAVWLA